MAMIYGSITFGDTSGDLTLREVGAAQTFQLQLGDDATLVGDANALLNHATGGADTFAVNTTGSLTIVGDAFNLANHALGGNDVIRAFATINLEIYGDGFTMTDHARGGADTIAVNGGLLSAIGVGDAETMIGFSVGGNDTMTAAGTRTQVHLYGDAVNMGGYARGGDDVLTANNPGPVLYGDARVLYGHAHGGDDLLTVQGAPIGAPFPTTTTVYGDGEQLLGHSVGGDDTLVGSTNQDIMYGDAAVVGPHARTGADLFVFSPSNGHDQIMDFEPGKDRIELQGFGFAGFQDLASHFQTTADGVLISFDTQDDILVRNVAVAQLHAHDFVLA
ncbi:MAG TPA: hypothetical protein VJS38_01355 [Phenylobacterium sp.]|uniref:M10 family metallopeptidase C-terminal domain-containing protein n=1 Tax=Phenylobacterium sp. TaxID=1871053 RepID=UPI002B489E76|nr:hypothetical protein [Phenylobacterium sp.]HKR86797.1 hypothetical protein [Phenylobacterium sp.]